MDFLTKYQLPESRNYQPVAGKSDLIRKAIEDGDLLEIVYLKPSDEKTKGCQARGGGKWNTVVRNTSRYADILPDTKKKRVSG